MIPRQVKKVNLGMSNFDDLEYKYLMEVPQDIRAKYKELEDEDCYSERKKLLRLFTDNGFAEYIFIGKIGDSNLFYSDRYLYTANIDEDFMYHDKGYNDVEWCFPLTEDVLKDMVGKRLCVGYRGHSDIIELLVKYENQEICIGDFIQRFLAYGFKEDMKRAKRDEETKIEREEQIKGNELEIEDFNKGEWMTNSSNSVYGSKNIIYNHKAEFTLSKKLNEIFTIEELNTAYKQYSRYGTEKLNWIESVCVSKCVSYDFVSSDKTRTYKVKFKKDKMYVDNVLIPVSRSSFFISRADGDTAKLKQLKELSAIKVEFLGLKSISISAGGYTYNIPIEVECIDKLFKVTLLDIVVEEDWKGLELFRHNIQSLRTRFTSCHINKIRDLFSISKSDMFDYMKKIQLLDKLGESDDEE